MEIKRKKLTQREKIQKLLEKGETITSFEAFSQFGITRLSAIIFDLRHKYDMNIKSEQIKCKNRYGETTYFDKYTLVKEEENGKEI